MHKALQEIGLIKAAKYAFYAPLLLLFDFLPYSPLRVFFLRIMGSKIGRNVYMGGVSFANVYRTGFKGLAIHDNCVVDDYVILDLANKITLESHVTIAWGSILVTHRNVGYKDHPLQPYFPPTNGDIVIRRGSFIGTHVTILDGVTVGEGVCVAANSLVNKSSESWVLLGGSPAQVLRRLRD